MYSIQRLHLICKCPVCKEEFHLKENTTSPQFSGKETENSNNYILIEMCYKCGKKVFAFIKSIRK